MKHIQIDVMRKLKEGKLQSWKRPVWRRPPLAAASIGGGRQKNKKWRPPGGLPTLGNY